MKIQPIILCGGSGTRLWPLSRTTYPKQMLSPLGGKSLLQQTILRFNSPEYASVILVCNDEHRFLVAEQVRDLNLNDIRIVLEPCSRNTAAAVMLGALFCPSDQTILFCPADHQIVNFDHFEYAIQNARPYVESNDVISIFGITPDAPKTGYGYMIPKESGDIFEIDSFIEKPAHEKACQLCAKGAFWNSGIFYAKASTFMHEIKIHLPDTYTNVQAAFDARTNDLDFIRISESSFSLCANISIDYGVLEKSKKIIGSACHHSGWSDIGSWESVWNLLPKDEHGNALQGDVVAQCVTNSYIRSDGPLVSAIGLDNVVIVATPDAILVCDKFKSETVKEMTTHLKGKKRSEIDNHKRVYRPWGYYHEIEIGERFKVKRLMVKPQEKTSVQIHYHRAEHWVVVSGTASVRLGDDIYIVRENESIYIPLGEKHAIENKGKIELHLIEIQSGSYLGEDDIVRIEDKYGRSS